MDTLTWDASYAIALALQHKFPDQALEDVSLQMIFDWTLELPNFEDDPEMVNQEILAAIYQEWYEFRIQSG